MRAKKKPAPADPNANPDPKKLIRDLKTMRTTIRDTWNSVEAPYLRKKNPEGFERRKAEVERQLELLDACIATTPTTAVWGDEEWARLAEQMMKLGEEFDIHVGEGA